MKRMLVWLLPILILPASRIAGAEDAKVGMANWVFSPTVATVRAGERVLWVNDDDSHHKIVFSDAAIKSSADIKPGKDYAVVFDKPGEYGYVCQYHKDYGMKGTVVVKERNK